MKLEKYSIGIGDRFGLQGVPQLRALRMAAEKGVAISPVWNKSQREHVIIGTAPGDTRSEADHAVAETGWAGGYFVDADHIGSATAGRFIESCDFFTIDVADVIGTEASPADVSSYLTAMAPFAGSIRLPGLDESLEADAALFRGVAGRYLNAVKEAARVYRRIREARKGREFVAEMSLDESAAPQSPAELYCILGAVGAEGIPLGTIAPKFSGSFFKGVDYVGDPAVFAVEFERDIAVVAAAVRAFRLPPDLKLSVHTGSDKFSLYPLMHGVLGRLNAGLHIKTAGTTWLEEVIGLAEGGGDGLAAAKEIYAGSYARSEELCAPYLQVIRIDAARLPSPSEVGAWSSEAFARALRHDQSCRAFNPHFRQLIHVGYKVAAEMGPRFSGLLKRYAGPIGTNVTHNIFHRHIVPLFLGAKDPD